MRKLYAMMAALMMAVAVQAQTLNVEVGQVTYQIPAEQAGEMLYQNGQTLTIINKEYTLGDITQMYIDDTQVVDDAVSVVYSGTQARVFVAGNAARYLTVNVSGAHVGIIQSSDLAQEITYTLSGATTDGEFYMEGSYKATVEFAGVTITNANPVYSGAAVYVKNGKRIDISVKKDTENSLTDCASPSADLAHKACLWVKGHADFKGKGTLNVNCKYSDAHAIKTGEYMTLKNCTINILAAGKDGLHASEYFLMQSGTLSVSGVGADAVQAELDGTVNTGQTTDHEGEDSGNIYIEGGTLTLTTTANGSKGLKSDSTIIITDGTLTINVSGGVDTSDSTDPAYVSAIAAGKFVQNGGTINITVKGISGRGVKAYDIETNGGELTINNSAGATTVSGDVKGAKGLKGLNIALNAGTISITMSGAAGKGIRAGDGTQSTSSSGGGGGGWGWGPGGGGGGMGGGSTWSNITGSYTQGKSDGTGPTITVITTGAASSSSSAKAIKAICNIYIYGGTTEVETSKSGAEGLESKQNIYIEGGQHYFKCYDDCINAKGKIFFNGGATVCYSNGNDAVDSNAGTTGAITIGNGAVFAFTTKGAPEEGLDCDNNSYIQITGTGIAISAGASQGGGGGGGGGSSSGNTISNAAQGYAFVTSTISYQANRYYTLANASGTNLVTYSFPASCSSSLALFTATGMVKNSSYAVKYSTTAPTDATTAWHGLYLGSTHKGTTQVTSFTAK
ncbi:MAG: carbohydrate-binding domain-containing protein [Prevotella sp.]|nr:carbohydrate-binding domain-containing protein [Prevotella sp.]